MKKTIDIQHWKRREHYLFFRRFDDPFYDVTIPVDMTRFSERVRKDNDPFFLSYLHASLEAVHQTPAFRQRIEHESVVEFDCVSAGPAIERPDGTFGFSRIPFNEDFQVFCRNAREEIDRIKKNSALHDDSTELDVVFYSTIPWFTFTGLSQPRMNLKIDSVPKIVFGKIEKDGNRLVMPMGIQVHHALVDGRDIAQYIHAFQHFLDT